jgi:hypothetical protein
MIMLRTLAIISLLPLLLLVGPASAATKEQKMETCKFGADDQKLEGAKRKTFIANCMANRNDKRGPAVAAKKPAAKKLITSPPADTAPAAPKQ